MFFKNIYKLLKVKNIIKTVGLKETVKIFHRSDGSTSIPHVDFLIITVSYDSFLRKLSLTA